MVNAIQSPCKVHAAMEPSAKLVTGVIPAKSDASPQRARNAKHVSRAGGHVHLADQRRWEDPRAVVGRIKEAYWIKTISLGP